MKEKLLTLPVTIDEQLTVGPGRAGPKMERVSHAQEAEGMGCATLSFTRSGGKIYLCQQKLPGTQEAAGENLAAKEVGRQSCFLKNQTEKAEGNLISKSSGIERKR